MLSDSEKYKLLVEWNDTRRDYPSDIALHESFQNKVRQDPNAVAIVCDDESLKYLELHKRSNQLANYLIKLGVCPNTLVGLCLDRSLEMIVGLIGILKAGGAYVPLDPIYPRERLGFMLEDTGINFVLTHSKLLTLLPELNKSYICIDLLEEEFKNFSTDTPVNQSSPEHLAYVIYTSGSTGRPKGVQITHANVQNYCYWFKETFEVRADDSFDFSSSLAFDLSVTTTIVPLLAGSSILICSEDIKRQPIKYLEHLASSAVNIIKLTPSYFKQLALLIDGQEKLHELRSIILGGEALYTHDVKDWLVLYPDVKLINEYGPTEATVATAAYEIPTSGDFNAGDVVPIGKPAFNTNLYILNEALEPCPIGETGQIYIGGESVSQGYLERPELTIEKFIPDPFNDGTEKRLYCTGDLARYDDEGNIEYLGRIDHQVKIRGYRIELGEIESVLQQHTDVKSATVQDVELEPGRKQLAAYLVCKGGRVPGVFELRTFLGKQLPDYMLPHYYVMLDEFPLTVNGKLDRKALPMPGKPVSQTDYVAPSNDTEKNLVSIWQQIFNMDNVGVSDNFFVLGGDSMLAALALLRMEENFGVNISLQNFYNLATIAEISELIDAKRLELRQNDEMELLRLLDQIENMNEDEVKSELLFLNKI